MMRIVAYCTALLVALPVLSLEGVSPEGKPADDHEKISVYVLGEVMEPGVIKLSHPVKALEILGLAGGLTEFADERDVILIRKLEWGDMRIRLDYRKMVDGDPKHNRMIEPDDFLVVPGRGDKPAV